MTPRIKLNITLLALIGTIVLLVVGIMQRRANPERAQAEEAEAIARRNVVFIVEDLLEFAAQTPPGPFPAEMISADLEARTGASWYFDKDPACWNTLQSGIKGSLAKPSLIPFREPNQPEPLLLLIEFDSGQKITLKFVQDSFVDCVD